MVELNPDKAHYIVATVIIVKEGKYLITKRADWEKAFPSKWTVPGGKLAKKDYLERKPDTNAGQWYNILETLAEREVFEETALKIKNIKYLANLTFIRPDGIPTIVISLYADYESGQVVLPIDLTDFKWVSLDELKNYDLIDGIYEEIEMLDKHLKGEKIGIWQKE